MGTETENGTVMSPATVLDHEIDHNMAYQNDSKYENRRNEKDANYSNKEEKRVIEGSEQKTAKANGEIKHPNLVTRTGHEGNPVITESETSNIVDESKTKIYREREKNKNWYNVEPN